LTLCLLAPALVAGRAAAAPALGAAEARVIYLGPGECRVALTLTIAADAAAAGAPIAGTNAAARALSGTSGTPAVEHRLEVRDGTAVVLDGVDDGALVAPAAEVGRTRLLRITPAVAGRPYTVRYAVQQPPSWAYRCPLWLPAIPTAGRTRTVRIEVAVPAGTSPGAAMPSLAWADGRGVATLAHLPAVVIVPFAAPGAAPPWDVARVMDVTALVVLAGGSAWWLYRRRAR